MTPVSPDTEALREALARALNPEAFAEYDAMPLDITGESLNAVWATNKARGRAGALIAGPLADILAQCDTAESALAAANATIAGLRADKERLDFLDRCNARLNEAYGTSYRWRLILNHNVTRLLLGGYDMGRPSGVDLHDSDGSNAALPSCREAIDEHLRKVKAALSSEGDDHVQA